MAGWPHDRSFFRIEYPRRERPFLRVGGVEHVVVDCCEAGVRFIQRTGETFARGDPLEGEMRFRRGEQVPVSGVVVRVQEGEVAVHLRERGIPFQIILAEQRYLRAHYPMWPARREP